ncbi:uncharacterized protein BDW43DRAFT_136339 [Aspergillus alliaceus]|uniref:uncharacterized protein n=1 Tax=Petromyces alliaceus TaxID=209559 RepID=UPI0012A4632B|nr:uncharacterized protein BDW43DRAFT_136339 [Aspergillus alliaceus]KAB8231409.1 hypothetical protein BDW43DRAFT_136339 [Aspergillus alliaceus]
MRNCLSTIWRGDFSMTLLSILRLHRGQPTNSILNPVYSTSSTANSLQPSQQHSPFQPTITTKKPLNYPPIGYKSRQSPTPPEQEIPEQLTIYRTLRCYLALSCNRNIIISTLCGSF